MDPPYCFWLNLQMLFFATAVFTYMRNQRTCFGVTLAKACKGVQPPHLIWFARKTKKEQWFFDFTGCWIKTSQDFFQIFEVLLLILFSQRHHLH